MAHMLPWKAVAEYMKRWSNDPWANDPYLHSGQADDGSETDGSDGPPLEA